MNMAMGSTDTIRLWVYGDNALFTRPEMKAERVSYEVMTPSAARGILDAIYFKPQMQWVITGIRVLAPVCFENIRRNEVSTKMTAPNQKEMELTHGKARGMVVEDVRQQRAALVLKNVSYIIEAHIRVLDAHESSGQINPNAPQKHLEVFLRRARVGGYFHHPYFGCREFPVSFELLERGGTEPPDTLVERNQHWGLMLHDLEYTQNAKGKIIIPGKKGKYSACARFYQAEMVDGLITVPPLSTL